MKKNNRYKNYYLLFLLLIKSSYLIFYKSIKKTIDQDGLEHAGYLAFLSLLSIFPALIFIIYIINKLENFKNKLSSIIIFSENDMIIQLLPRLSEIINNPPQTILTLALIGIIWTSSSMVEAIRTILNRSYNIRCDKSYIIRRIASIIEFIILIIILILSLTFFIIIPNILIFLSKYFDYALLLEFNMIMRNVIFIIIIFININMIYYFIPNQKQSFINTVPGSIMFIILSSIMIQIGIFYFKNFNQLNLIYGNIANIIFVLMLFYLINVILIFGANFNYFFHKKILSIKKYKKNT